jgi:hypothetical protein
MSAQLSEMKDANGNNAARGIMNGEQKAPAKHNPCDQGDPGM